MADDENDYYTALPTREPEPEPEPDDSEEEEAAAASGGDATDRPPKPPAKGSGGGGGGGRPPRLPPGQGQGPGQGLYATRTTQLQALVEKRRMNLAYLQRAHGCSSDNNSTTTGAAGAAAGASKGPGTGTTVYWLNTVALDAALVQAYVEAEVPKTRPLLFLRLGLSLGRLLLLFAPDAPDNDADGDSKQGTEAGTGEAAAALGETAALVRALLQLFEELDYFTANGAVQSMRLLLARPADSPYPEPRTRLGGPGGTAAAAAAADALAGGTATPPPSPPRPHRQQQQPQPRPPPSPSSSSTTTNDTSDPATEPLAAALQPRLLRFGPDPAYECLQPVPPPPYPLSYPLLLHSLSHLLSQAYTLLGSPRHAASIAAHAYLFDAVVRVDAAVKHHVINPVAKGLTDLAARAAKRELEWVRDTYLGGGGGGGRSKGGGGGMVV